MQRHVSEVGPLTERSLNSKPKSMYNFCMHCLAISEHPWREPALGYLCVLFVTEQVLILGFHAAALFQAMGDHTLPLPQRPDSFAHCIENMRSIGGQPVLYFSTCVIAIILVSLLIKADVEDLALVQYPGQDSSFCLRGFVCFLWLNHEVILPTFFITGCGQVFANCQDSMEVVMSTLACTFILEVDNMFYDGMLNSKQKTAYERYDNDPASCEDSTDSPQSSWPGFAWSFSFMCIHFLVLRFLIDGLDNSQYDLSVQIETILPVVAIGTRGVMHARTVSHAGRWAWFWHSCRVFAFSAASALVWYTFMVFVLTGVHYDRPRSTCVGRVH